MARTYDVVVLGTGTAARVAAMRCQKAGWSVAVVDCQPFGGTCALRGCDPKKVLVGAATAIDHARRMQPNGVTGAVRIDWPELMAFKRSFTDPVPAKHEADYRAKGVDAFHGVARFAAKDAVLIDGERIEARHVVIATGAKPRPLGIPGEEHVITSDAFLSLDALPRRIVLIGGGYVAAEFSHVAARAGAEVTILQRADRLLPRFDADLMGWLTEKFRAIGVEVRTRTTVEAVERIEGGYRVRASSGGKPQAFEADLVVHAAGRVPNLDGLALEAGGVEAEGGRLRLNEFLQSVSNPAVYAAGDAAEAGPPLTPVSSHDAKVVAANLLKGNYRRPDYRGVPSVAFTVPPIATVGLGEAEAQALGLDFRVNCERTSGWFTARQAAEPVSGHKVLVENGTERILGAHLLGPHADEVVNLFALAIRHGLTADALRSTMFGYPTGASDVGYMLG